MIPQGMSPERQPLVLNPLGLSGCDCGMRIVGGTRPRAPAGREASRPYLVLQGIGGFVLI
jgi:hypothetical protein